MIVSLNLSAQTAITDSMLVRISEIQVYPQYLDEYLQYAHTVGAASVKKEPGVVCIYPMQTRRDACLIRILEIYVSQEAYRHRIHTAHFLKYKTETLKMVKSLDLVDMNMLDPETMPLIFTKMPLTDNKKTADTATIMNRIELCKKNYTTLFGGEALNGRGTDPEMMDILQKYIFGEVFHTGNLDKKIREMITCVTLATLQQLPQLTAHAAAALNVGITPIELREAIYQCASYIGFPKMLNALGAINATFQQRGIKLPMEKQATTTEENRYEKGYAIQRGCYGDSIKEMLCGLPEGMDEEVARYFTEVHFGDFYTRNGMDLKARGLLSYCVITTMGINELLRPHLEGALRMGNCIETITAAVIQCMPNIGFPTAFKSLKAISDYTTKAE